MTTKDLKQPWMEAFEVVIGEDIEKKEQSEFGKLLESEQTTNFKEGEVFNGKVVNVGNDYVLVDIGYKQEGLVFAREFKNYDGTLKVKEGDEIEVY